MKVIALFRMRDDKGVDDKVSASRSRTRTGTRIETLDDLPQPLRDEISHFYSIYKQPEGKHVRSTAGLPRGRLARSRAPSVTRR